jgi:hypothetical protein
VIARVGEWALARRLFAAGPQRLRTAIGAAVQQEAHKLRGDIVQGLTQQSPGGEPLKPPSPLTIASRQLDGFRGQKALIVRGDLRNAVAVVVEGDEAFIGVPRTARNKDGDALVDVAKVQEFGGPPVVIPITPKMRKFLFALLRRSGKDRGSEGGSGRGVVVVQVPARPFLRPAFEKFKQGAGRRFLVRVAEGFWRRS